MEWIALTNIVASFSRPPCYRNLHTNAVKKHLPECVDYPDHPAGRIIPGEVIEAWILKKYKEDQLNAT